MKGKKGQEEIVGFLLIVLIVIILGVIFLFMFNDKPIETQDSQVENLLISMIGTTIDGKTIGERIENCERGDGCDVLSNNLNNLTDMVFKKMGYSLGRNIKGYNLTISEGMEYSNAKGNATAKSVAYAMVVGMRSFAKLKFYY
ncbi:MAG: hypothetical protein KKE23_00835 [Nanoarchaeota archaeon]|nr:hypothetical protein [Nanoarchaeota archaeon]